MECLCDFPLWSAGSHPSDPVQIIPSYAICVQCLFERFEGVSFVLLRELTSLHRGGDIPLILVNININEEL